MLIGSFIGLIIKIDLQMYFCVCVMFLVNLAYCVCVADDQH